MARGNNRTTKDTSTRYQAGTGGNKSTRFQKGQSGNPNGRPRKILTIIKEMGFGKQDIITAFGELMWYTDSDLENLYKAKDTPAMIKIVAKNLYEAIRKGDMYRLRELMDYTVGKPAQKMENTNNNYNYNVELTKDNIRKINKALEDEY